MKTIAALTAMLGVVAIANGQIVHYSTSFEAPTYPAGSSVVGIDGWDEGSGAGASQSVTDTFASSGMQSLLWHNDAGNNSFYSVRRAVPAVSDVLTASAQLWIAGNTQANRLYGIYYGSSPTSTLGGTILGISIAGDGSFRAGTSWSQTYSNTGLFFTADPGTYVDRWLTINMSWDPATGDGNISVTGLGGTTPTVNANFAGVAAPGNLQLGSDWFTTSDREGMAFVDNVRITEVPAPGALALLGLGGLFAARRRR